LAHRVARKVGHRRWGRRREMLEVLIDGYKEECFKGGRFGF
jgi:hypothetical protein